MPLPSTVELVISMLTDNVVAKEFGRAGSRVSDERLLLGEFQFERVMQERSEFLFDLLCFRFWATETKHPVG